MRTNMEYDPNAFKDVPSDPYVIDLTECKTYTDVHLAIKNGLDFPDYYGENLSALWDSGYDFCVRPPGEKSFIVEFRGTANLPKDAKETFEDTWPIFIRLRKEFPEATFKIVS